MTAQTPKTLIETEQSPLLLFFERQHSPGCRWMWGTLHAVLLKHPEVKLVRVDVHDHPELAKEHRVTSVPHVAVVLNGKALDYRRGVYTPSYLQAWLAETLAR